MGQQVSLASLETLESLDSQDRTEEPVLTVKLELLEMTVSQD
jgi:hypothetical protein